MWLGLNRIFAAWRWPPGTWAPDAFSLLNRGFFDGILPLTGSYWWCQAQEVLTVTTSYHNCRLFGSVFTAGTAGFLLQLRMSASAGPFQRNRKPGPVVNIPFVFFFGVRHVSTIPNRCRIPMSPYPCSSSFSFSSSFSDWSFDMAFHVSQAPSYGVPEWWGNHRPRIERLRYRVYPKP